jgi:hypothetical protein
MGRKVVVVAAALTVLGSIACGGPAKEGAEGADCYRAEECAAGLVCIDKRCTSDLTSVNFRADAGMVADAGTGPAD